MAVADGDYSATALQKLILTQDDIFSDPRQNRFYKPKSETIIALVTNQTANITPLTSSDRDVEITFLNNNFIQARDCEDETCDPTGTEAKVEAVPYELTQCVEITPFEVPTYAFRDNTTQRQSVIAANLLRVRKEMEEAVGLKADAKLFTFAGKNLDPTGEYGATIDTPGTTTTVPAVNWNENIIPYFQLSARMNQFDRPYFIHGTNLYLLGLSAGTDALNDNERDIAAKLRQFGHYWDPENFIKLAQIKSSLMIDAPSVAFASRNYFTTTPVSPKSDVANFALPSISTVNGQPLFYMDVTVTTVCRVKNGKKEYYDVYEAKVPKFDVINNPANGPVGNTGVLKFVKP